MPGNVRKRGAQFCRTLVELRPQSRARDGTDSLRSCAGRAEGRSCMSYWLVCSLTALVKPKRKRLVAAAHAPLLACRMLHDRTRSSRMPCVASVSSSSLADHGEMLETLSADSESSEEQCASEFMQLQSMLRRADWLQDQSKRQVRVCVSSPCSMMPRITCLAAATRCRSATIPSPIMCAGHTAAKADRRLRAHARARAQPAEWCPLLAAARLPGHFASLPNKQQSRLAVTAVP